MKQIIFIASLFILLTLPSCTKDYDENFIGDFKAEEWEILNKNLSLPEEHYDYGLFEFHPNNAEITLGRVLFYDKNLSDAGEISCASCHKQELAFADDKAFSVGVRGEETLRNSIALGQFKSFGNHYNSGASGLNEVPIFWDGRAINFHDQMIETMSNPIEMDIDISKLVKKVEETDYYNILMKQAYETELVDAEKITRALEKFIRTIQNNDTKFDKERSGNSLTSVFSGYTEAENRGKSIFLTRNCNNCHSLNETSSLVFANNGLESEYQDQGVFEVSNLQRDKGKFKIPILRNIELTAPYMHDGRFKTLEEVIDFYSNGIQNHPNLSNDLKIGSQPRKFNFSTQEKEDLIAFLKTLTDNTLTHDPKWSDPFRN